MNAHHTQFFIKDLKNLKPGKNLYINFLFAFIIIIFFCITIIIYKQIDRMHSAQHWEMHTYEVIKANNKLLLDLYVMESSVRAYALSGESYYISNFGEKIKTILNDFENVKSLTIDNDIQQKALNSLRPLIDKRIMILKDTLDYVAHNKFDAIKIRNIIQNGQGLTDEIREISNAIYLTESELLKERETRTIGNFNNVIRITSIASILDIIFLIILFIVISQLLKNLGKARSESKKSESLLLSIFSGTHEFIAALDLNFRFISFNRSFEREFKEAFGKRVFIGMSLKDALAHLPNEQKKAIDIWNRALSGEEFTVTEQFGSNEKSQKTYEISYSSIYDENNQLIGASHIVRDVTARIINEKKLRLSKMKLEKHSKEMSLINAMNNVLGNSSSLNETLRMVIIYLKKLLPFSAGIIYLMNPSKNYLASAIEWSDPINDEKIFPPHDCWALKKGKVYTKTCDEADLPCDHIKIENNNIEYCCVPLLAQNDIVGILYIELSSTEISQEKKEHMLKRNLLLITNLSGQIALAISNIKLKEFLKKRSTRDPLTDLYNRSYLSDTLERDLQRAKRDKKSIAVIMMDLDHFKNVNDSYGHDEGDIILKRISKLLLEQCRGGDIVCRYGGEEFMLVLYDIDVQSAYQKLDKIRIEIANMQFKAAETIYSITASFGIVGFPEHFSNDAEKLIKAADTALYQSKKQGRNRITIYSPDQSP